MAMSAGRPTAPGGPVATINVTPMADIMIVLLIIFMVITPLLRETEGLVLPAAGHSREQKETREDVVVVVRSDTTTLLGSERMDNLGELLLAVRVRLDEVKGERTVFVKADRRLPYAAVEKVLEVCREAGAERIALMATLRVDG